MISRLDGFGSLWFLAIKALTSLSAEINSFGELLWTRCSLQNVTWSKHRFVCVQSLISNYLFPNFLNVHTHLLLSRWINLLIIHLPKAKTRNRAEIISSFKSVSQKCLNPVFILSQNCRWKIAFFESFFPFLKIKKTRKFFILQIKSKLFLVFMKKMKKKSPLSISFWRKI